jgi:FkbH-like protein
VLIGVASKNDPALVECAFDRSDLLISRSDIFLFEVHWSRKSESVKRILGTWNVAADSVVFIDDSPMEVAEVKAALPEVECIVFPKSDYQGILGLLKYLRGVFGKPFLTEDDTVRLAGCGKTPETGYDQGVLSV